MQTTLAAELHARVALLAPIVGVSIGDAADKTTWRIDFLPEATDSEKAASADCMASFDPATAIVRQIRKSTVVARLTDTQLDQALALMNNRQKERWRAPDHPVVDVDDPELLQVLQAVGADPAVVLAAD